MQVNRTRYTPSDIGPSPADWDAPRLSEVATLITNGFVGTASPFYSDETGVSYLYGTNVRANKIDLSNLRYITNEFHKDQQKTSLRAGDLLTVQSGHIGETAVVPKYLENSNCHALIVTRLKPKLVNSNFLCQYINSEIGIARLRGLEVGSTIAHINTKDLKKFRIPLPPLPEQKKIAAILSTWDRAIEGTEKLLANSQQQKKALMQQLLTGKKRLPGFTGEWKNILLKNIALIKKGQALSSKDLIHGDYPVIAGGKTSPYTHKHFTHENVITVSASGAYAGYVSFHSYKIWASDCSVITSRPENNISFIYFWLSYLQNKIFSLQSGGAQPHIYPRDLELLHIHCPPLSEQQAIAAVLTTADEEITAIESDLSRLRQEKKALMQQLLTGKRRVKVD